MSTLSLLERAQAHLTEMRDESTPGPWEVDGNEPFSRDLVGIFAPESRGYAIRFDEGCQPTSETAELIVALHRTIDAQLEVLAEGIANLRAGAWTWMLRAPIVLARAILEEPADE